MEHILENVVRCYWFEVGVHIKNPIKNSCEDGLGGQSKHSTILKGKSCNTHIIASRKYNVWHVN